MFYVCAGLYAEGPSDDQFLLPLVDRLLQELLREHFPAQHVFEDSYRLRDMVKETRERRIAATILEHWGMCTLFVIHSDGAGDPEAARARTITPAITLAREQLRSAGHKDPLAIAACIPVRELEAWLLADASVFERLGVRDVELPTHPERVTDPKLPLAEQLKRVNLHRRPPFNTFGQHVPLAALRKLESFRTFEAELLAALHLLARPGGRA